MTLEVSKIYSAALAIEQMRIQHELPYRTVRAFQRIRRALKEEAGNIRSEQTKLMELHHGVVKNDGKIAFTTQQDRAAFEAAWEALFNDTADMEIEPVDLSEYAEFIHFSSVDADIEALCNFVIIEKE